MTGHLEPTRLVVVDDNPMFARAICRSLLKVPGVKVVAVAHDGETGLYYIRREKPDVALIDLRMAGMKGADLTRTLKASNPHVAVVALTVSQHQEDLLDVLRAGASGYVLKSAAQEEVPRAIAAAAQGESWLSPKMAAKLIDSYTELPSTVMRESLRDHPDLTPREQAVLAYLAQGMMNGEIAEALSVSETTVKSHVKSIFGKLDVRNRSEAVAMTWSRGLALAAQERQSGEAAWVQAAK